MSNLLSVNCETTLSTMKRDQYHPTPLPFTTLFVVDIEHIHLTGVRIRRICKSV